MQGGQGVKAPNVGRVCATDAPQAQVAFAAAILYASDPSRQRSVARSHAPRARRALALFSADVGKKITGAHLK
jgi:hypothetical protein